MTLIDQFAWMTDVLLYRVNRIPERLHWKLLELLDVRAQPPTSAHTLLRFRLAKPPQQPLVIPAGTEVATKPDTEHPAVVFAVTADATVPVTGLAGVALERSDALTSIAVLDGVARPLGSDREAFSVLPQSGDALYLGFATSPERLVLQVHVKATEARGTGIDPDLPPVVWEVPRADGTWSTAVEVLSDRTGGFNYPVGTTEVQVPQHCVETVVGGRRMYWLRCRIAYPARRRGPLRHAAADREDLRRRDRRPRARAPRDGGRRRGTGRERRHARPALQAPARTRAQAPAGRASRGVRSRAAPSFGVGRASTRSPTADRTTTCSASNRRSRTNKRTAG